MLEFLEFWEIPFAYHFDEMISSSLLMMSCWYGLMDCFRWYFPLFVFSLMSNVLINLICCAGARSFILFIFDHNHFENVHMRERAIAVWELRHFIPLGIGIVHSLGHIGPIYCFNIRLNYQQTNTINISPPRHFFHSANIKFNNYFPNATCAAVY